MSHDKDSIPALASAPPGWEPGQGVFGECPPGTRAQRVGAPHPADGAGEGPPGWGTRGWQGLSSTSACPHLPGRLAGGQTASPSPRSESFPLDGWPQGFRPQGLSHGRWLLQGHMGTTRAGMERSAHLPAAHPLLSSPVPDGPRPGGGGSRSRHTGRPHFLPMWSCAPGVILETEVWAGHHALCPPAPLCLPTGGGPCGPLWAGPGAETH